MAARNNLNNQVAGETQRSTNRVVALFSKREDAYHALSKLKEAGFDNDRIGLAVGYEQKQTQEYDSSFWQKIKDFFTGEDHHEGTDFQDVSAPMGWTDERYRYYERAISSGGAVVTVTGERLNEARTILQQYGGDLRDSGFETSGSRFAGTTGIQNEQRIQLRGEMLRTYKERVKRGEVRLHKEVITENQTVQVPVTREELVVERTPASGQAATGEIGDDQEVRVPLSEERVRVEKQPVVNEEVRIGKRQVQSSQQVSDKVKHEELRVEKEGEVESDTSKPRGDRKGRVA
jgi:uncharacterized protein (TIGR02271 family)